MTQTTYTPAGTRWLSGACVALGLVLSTMEASAQTEAQWKRQSSKFPDYPLTLAEQGNFYVNGHYVVPNDTTAEHIMARQMYVSYKIPRHVTQRYPIVLIHGGGLTGSGFDATPDGREGWADFFVARGYKVYVVDQPARGRSAYHPEINGPFTTAGTAERLEQRFTAPEDFNLWPQAHLHNQWPGSGRIGDTIFDQFFASEVRGVPSDSQENLTQDAGAQLLDKIGPAIILTHSQSGPHGWLIADARPNKVAGIVAVEPSGPPFFDVLQVGPPDWFEVGPLARPWGITATQIHYAPEVTDPSQLAFVYQDAPDGPDLVRCHLQAAPARQLPRLQGIPIVIIASGAGYHRSYDHCTSQYLRQAGVLNTFIPLDQRGIEGNGHMMMLEKNNLQIARVIHNWIKNHVASAAQGVVAK
jgi:pimeloyl-ACP methyl ester carboxylesterase